LTGIIAANCPDGVVIVPDRKITFPTKAPNFRNDKVISKYYPIVISYAGSIVLSKYFIDRAYELAQTHSYNSLVPPKPPRIWQRSVTSGAVQITIDHEFDYYVEYPRYISQLGSIVHDLNQRFSEQAGSPFEVTVSTQIAGSNARLCNITTQGKIHDGIDIKCIASAYGYATKALAQKWDKNMSTKETAKVGYTILDSISDGLDSGVGFGGQDPDIWFIPKMGQIYQANAEMKAQFRAYAKDNRADNRAEYKKIMTK
jgi:20S proteasome alpha/beta subunit